MQTDRPSCSRGGIAFGFAAVLLAAHPALAAETKADQQILPDQRTLKVCADPNNLPFSDREGRGFENKLAELIGRELGRQVTYTWWAQRRGFVRNTLNAGDCDAIMGVPAHYDLVAATRPYYRSTYVFVARADRGYALRSMKDPRLHALSIGVQLIGNDGFNTPPAHALGEQGITANVIGYTLYGDYRDDSPPARIVEAVAAGDVDVAAVWGPLAGYFAKQSQVPLEFTPIADTEDFAPLRFQYDIAVGVRKADAPLRTAIDNVIARDRDEITRLLRDYGVPLLDIAAQAQSVDVKAISK
jgi:mxaJ protein